MASVTIGIFMFRKCLKKQNTMTEKINAVSTETKKLETIYQQKINDLEELKKSVLQKAFSGELRSPEGATYANDGYSPSDKKKSSTKSPESVYYIMTKHTHHISRIISPFQGLGVSWRCHFIGRCPMLSYNALSGLHTFSYHIS